MLYAALGNYRKEAGRRYGKTSLNYSLACVLRIGAWSTKYWGPLADAFRVVRPYSVAVIAFIPSGTVNFVIKLTVRRLMFGRFIQGLGVGRALYFSKYHGKRLVSTVPKCTHLSLVDDDFCFCSSHCLRHWVKASCCC